MYCLTPMTSGLGTAKIVWGTYLEKNYPSSTIYAPAITFYLNTPLKSIRSVCSAALGLVFYTSNFKNENSPVSLGREDPLMVLLGVD